LHGIQTTLKRSSMDHTVLPATNAMPALPRKRSPDGAAYLLTYVCWQELTEKLDKMRFRLQLTSIDEQRSVIPQRQDTLRGLMQRARRLERELYRLERSRDSDDVDDALDAKIQELEFSLEDTKEQV